MAGKVSKMTKETLRKLEDAYLCDATHLQAAKYAGIAESTLHLYRKENPAFSERIEQLKGMTSLRAKMNLEKSIQEGDKHDSKWWLERRDKEFKAVSKQEVELGAHKSLIDAILESKKSCKDK